MMRNLRVVFLSALPPGPSPPATPTATASLRPARRSWARCRCYTVRPTTTANDEAPDAWPPDFNDDRSVDIFDTLLFKPVFNTSVPNPYYDARRDLNANGMIDIFDVLHFKPFFGKSCTP